MAILGDLEKLLNRNAAVSLGALAMAGFLLGSGVIRLPQLGATAAPAADPKAAPAKPVPADPFDNLEG